MFQLITTKGRKNSDTIDGLAAWYAEMQPSSSRIVWGDIEAEIDEHIGPMVDTDNVDDVASCMRRALRMAEAEALGLTINNDNIYIDGLDGPYITIDAVNVTLHDADGTRTEIDDDTTLKQLVQATN